MIDSYGNLDCDKELHALRKKLEKQDHLLQCLDKSLDVLLFWCAIPSDLDKDRVRKLAEDMRAGIREEK